jgi:diguanylate cyclase (GGDEF)-like protein
VRPELLIVDGKIVAVRLAGQDFPSEPEGAEAIIPKSVLKGFLLSEIPQELTIKPVESVAQGRIEIKHDIQLSSFAEGSASALIEVMLRRKHWDGDVGLTPYIEAYRYAIRERDEAEESDFQDDGDYIFLHYEITIDRDLEIQDAISHVEGIISHIENRTEQIAHRRQDALTGISDRGTFDADLAHAADSSQASPLSLLIIDLDKFKAVNDTYGHEAGDEVLVKVANVLRLACGHEGSCYRYGGDEMTVLLPKHNLQHATVIAEQIRASIAGLKFERCPENITASIGATTYPETTKAPDDIFSDADAMVYEAKEDGGNAVRGAMTTENRGDSVRMMRLDIASRVEAVELWMRLQQGNERSFWVVVTNDSDEDVTIEAITLRKGSLYLSEPSKPKPKDDWKIGKHSSQTINWEASVAPVQKLKVKEPEYQNRTTEIDIVVWGRVLGRRKKFSHTILALVNYGNLSMSEIM